MSKSPIKNIHEFIATFFLVGKAPKAPGTFGTLAAAIIYYYLPRLFYVVRGALTGVSSHIPLSEGDTGSVLTGNVGILPALDSLSSSAQITGNVDILPALDSLSSSAQITGNVGILPALDSLSSSAQITGNVDILPALDSLSSSAQITGNVGILPALDSLSSSAQLTGNVGILPALNPLPLIYDSTWWLLFLISFFFLGVYSSTKAEKTMGHDNGHIVIDEVLGYWVALYLFPPSLYYIIFGFLLFRLFDIAKPYPINKLQNLPKGWGVMVDDLLAGVYTAIVLGAIDLIWFLVKPI